MISCLCIIFNSHCTYFAWEVTKMGKEGGNYFCCVYNWPVNKKEKSRDGQKDIFYLIRQLSPLKFPLTKIIQKIISQITFGSSRQYAHTLLTVLLYLASRHITSFHSRIKNGIYVSSQIALRWAVAMTPIGRRNWKKYGCAWITIDGWWIGGNIAPLQTIKIQSGQIIWAKMALAFHQSHWIQSSDNIFVDSKICVLYTIQHFDSPSHQSSYSKERVCVRQGIIVLLCAPGRYHAEIPKTIGP
jgi:hypothetical protein